MEMRKTLLKAARLLALTGVGAAGAQGAAEAAISPERVETGKTVSSTQVADPLFEIMQRTNGSLSSAALTGALREMFPAPTVNQVNTFPGLFKSLHGMGASMESLTEVRHLLVELVTTAQHLSHEAREKVVEQLESNTTGYRLAQNSREDEQRRRRREREELGQTPGAPAAAS